MATDDQTTKRAAEADIFMYNFKMAESIFEYSKHFPRHNVAELECDDSELTEADFDYSEYEDCDESDAYPGDDEPESEDDIDDSPNVFEEDGFKEVKGEAMLTQTEASATDAMIGVAALAFIPVSNVKTLGWANRGNTIALTGEATLALGLDTAVDSWYAFIKSDDKPFTVTIEPSSGLINCLPSVEICGTYVFIWYESSKGYLTGFNQKERIDANPESQTSSDDIRFAKALSDETRRLRIRDSNQVNTGEDYDSFEDAESFSAENHLEITFRNKILKSNCANALMQALPAPSFVAGLFPRGGVTGVASPGGAGKTFLLTQLAICLAANKSFLGQAAEQGTSLGLFREDPESEFRVRLNGLFSDFSIEPGEASARFRYDCYCEENVDHYTLWHNRKPTKNFRQLIKIIRRIEDLDLVIIDTVKLAFMDENTDPLSASAFVRACQAVASQFNIAIILVTHTNNDGKVSGTSEWFNHLRCVYTLWKHCDHYIFECKKSNWSKVLPSILLSRSENGGFIKQLKTQSKQSRGRKPEQIESEFERTRAFFLEDLDNSRKPLTAKKNTPNGNYAPKVFAESRRGKQLGMTQAALEAAMLRLLAEGILVEVPGPTKSKAKILRRVEAEG